MQRSANQFRPTRRTVSPTCAECKAEAFCQPSLACQPAAFFQPAPRCQPAPRPTSAVCQPHCRADRRLFANAVLEPTRFRQNSPVLPTGTVVPTGNLLPTTVVPPALFRRHARATNMRGWLRGAFAVSFAALELKLKLAVSDLPGSYAAHAQRAPDGCSAASPQRHAQGPPRRMPPFGTAEDFGAPTKRHLDRSTLTRGRGAGWQAAMDMSAPGRTRM